LNMTSNGCIDLNIEPVDVGVSFFELTQNEIVVANSMQTSVSAPAAIAVPSILGAMDKAAIQLKLLTLLPQFQSSRRNLVIMVELYSGIENTQYTEGDAKNLHVENRAEYRGKDMKATLDYFEDLKKEDPDFYYRYTLDEYDRVENLFWVDGAPRRAY
ncbi:hypothetical protein BAE44_0004980, partial [Dichanthelium oligosanthes]